MSTDAGGDRSLWMTLGLGDGHGTRLAIDLRDPSRLVELPDLHHLDGLPAGAMIVSDGDRPELDTVEGDRILVPRAFLWSLLAPRETGRRRRLVVHDRLAAEQRLREEGRRIWDGVAAWASLDADLRAGVRDLLAPWSKAHATLLDTLASLASRPGADPFAGWDDGGAMLPEPPAAPPSPLPADPLDLEAWMADPDGLGRLYGDGFRPRFGQGDMARAVAESLSEGRPLLVEAGTGVGKTLGYLLPLLAGLSAGERRAVVSTHTRALQAQILEQDLPRLAGLAPDLTARRLMGRANYLCRTRRLRFLRYGTDSLADAWALASFRLWLAVTTEGMREEVEDHPALRQHLGVLFDSPEPCSPAVCYGREECHVQRARRLARDARLVVVNHALLMNDCAAGHTLVGEYDDLVVDEAHRLPGVALDTFSIVCDASRSAVLEELVDAAADRTRAPAVSERVARSLERIGEPGEQAAARAREAGRAVVRAADELRRWLDALASVHSVRPAGDGEAAGTWRVRVYDRAETFGPVADDTTRLLAACAEAGRCHASLAGALECLADVPEGVTDELATLARSAELVQSLEEDMLFLTGIEDDEWVVWLEPDKAGRFRAAGATRLDAGDLLREQWLASHVTPVATSATLGIGEDLSYMARELGMTRPGSPPDVRLVPSPFDIEKQALHLAPSGFPAPDAPNHAAALASLVDGIMAGTPRKTMVLFTSYRALKAVRDALAASDDGDHAFRTDTDRLWSDDRPVVLSQGGGVSAAELLARFRQERRAVLLGTNTFWEGVDLPGRELEVLIVPRLPFPVPTDPWVEARSDRMKAHGENPFTGFMLREAVLRLRQGVGRLIRTESDRGVVVLLDGRLHSKPYGMTFLKALPVPVRYCEGAEDTIAAVAGFFDGAPRP